MHTLTKTPITLKSFEIDDYNEQLITQENDYDGVKLFEIVDTDVSYFISFLEQLRKKYLETNDKRYWKELIRWLPESFLQTRTVTMNYAVLRNIIKQRRNHKLTEWHTFIDRLKQLPYAKELLFYGLEEDD